MYLYVYLVLGGHFGPEKKYLVPPPQNSPQTPSRLRFFVDNTLPRPPPRTPPPLPRAEKIKKYPKRPPRVNCLENPVCNAAGLFFLEALKTLESVSLDSMTYPLKPKLNRKSEGPFWNLQAATFLRVVSFKRRRGKNLRHKDLEDFKRPKFRTESPYFSRIHGLKSQERGII